MLFIIVKHLQGRLGSLCFVQKSYAKDGQRTGNKEENSMCITNFRQEYD